MSIDKRMIIDKKIIIDKKQTVEKLNQNQPRPVSMSSEFSAPRLESHAEMFHPLIIQRKPTVESNISNI